MTPRRRQHPRGFFFLDVLLGLVLIGLLGTIMAGTATRTVRADQRLADSRAATRAAERVLVILQSGAAPPKPDDGTLVTVTRPDAQTGDRVWVRVDAVVNGRTGTLYGLL